MLKIGHRNKYLAFVILIGGRSTRFGSDKGTFEFLGKPLISYQLDTLSKFKKDVFLVSRSKQQVQEYVNKIDVERVMAFILDDTEFILDPAVYSPMIGLHSAFKELNKLDYEKAFALSCDIPLVKYEVIKLLIKQSKGCDCCIPRWNNGFVEPLCAIYPIKEGLEKTRENLKNNALKLVNLLEKGWNINYISVEKTIQPLDQDLVTFININEPKDLEKLKKIH